MTASLDEGDFGFTVDAPATLDTNFYMLMGSNIYTKASSFSDRDAYFIITSPGSRYTVVSQDNLTVGNTFVDLYDRFGNFLLGSMDLGSGAGLSFTATDTKYYAVFSAERSGVYIARVENNSIREANGIGEFITAGTVYSAALDFVSDADNYFFDAVADKTYRLTFSSQIADIFLKVSFLDDFSYIPQTVTTVAGGVFTFTPGVTGRYELAVSSNNFVGVGSYSFVANELDVTSPVVTGFVPADGAANVLASSNIVVTFSETVARGTGVIEIRSGSAAGPIVESFDVATSGRLTVSGSRLTIDPTVILAGSTQHFVVITSGAIRDVAGNAYNGTSAYDFTTAPVVAGTDGNDTLQIGLGAALVSGGGGDDLFVANAVQVSNPQAAGSWTDRRRRRARHRRSAKCIAGATDHN